LETLHLLTALIQYIAAELGVSPNLHLLFQAVLAILAQTAWWELAKRSNHHKLTPWEFSPPA
jgi:hypothetical protein